MWRKKGVETKYYRFFRVFFLLMDKYATLKFLNYVLETNTSYSSNDELDINCLNLNVF